MAGWPGAREVLFGFARDAAMDVLTASALVAVHRLVLLGEAADRPAWRLPAQFDRYLLWLLLLELPFLPVTVLNAWAGPVDPAQPVDGRMLLVLGAHVLLAGAGVWAAVRLSLVLPLAAMGAPGAGWRAAWDASRKRAWRLLGANLMTFVPMEVGAWVVAGLARDVEGPAGVALGVAGEAARALLWSVVGAALWSRLLQAHGGVLGRKPVWTLGADGLWAAGPWAGGAAGGAAAAAGGAAPAVSRAGAH